MELHLAVAIGSDFVHLEIHRCVVDDVDLASAELFIDDLRAGDELEEFVGGHVLDLAADGLFATVLLIYIPEHLHVFLDRRVAGLVVHLLRAEVVRVELVEVGHHVLLESADDRLVQGPANFC